MISSLGVCAAFDMEPIHPSLPFVRSYQIQMSFYCGVNRDAVLLCLQDTFMIWFLNTCMSFNMSPYASACRYVHVVAGVHRGQRCQISQEPELYTWLEAPESELDLGGLWKSRTRSLLLRHLTSPSKHCITNTEKHTTMPNNSEGRHCLSNVFILGTALSRPCTLLLEALIKLCLIDITFNLFYL